MKNITYWLEEIVIGLNLCPFAKQPYKNGLVRVVISEAIDEHEQITFFLNELQHLQNEPSSKISTTIIAYTRENKNFQDFNNFVGILENLLIQSGLEEHFQLVAFHPQFQFDEIELTSPANWVGRSPYPIVHLLRNSEIEMALANNLNMEQIPMLNEEKLRALSQEELSKIFYYL